MSAVTKRIQTVDVSLPTEPGALAKVFGIFREAKINCWASWGYEMGPNQGQAHFYVRDPELAMKTLNTAGMNPKKTDAIWFEGDDHLGQYAELLTKIQKAGVNIGATDAFAIGNRFATVIFPANAKDYPALCKALNI